MPTDRILDAAGDLFAERGIASVGMVDIARAAGCSRATLYRYFENRDALHTAYVHREARVMATHLAGVIADIDDPRERLLAGVTHALRLVRESPALSAWFTTSVGADAADRSQVVRAMTAAFLESLDSGDAAAVDRRARWLVRVLTSLLVSPGRDADDERAILEEFVIPAIAPNMGVRRVSRVPG